MSFIFTNNASSLLAVSLAPGDVSIQVGAGEGALFPTFAGAAERAAIALVNADGDLEVCYATARSGDLLTVLRGQEGTTAQSWTSGVTRVELRITKGTMENMMQRDGASMSNNLSMNGNNIIDGNLVDGSVVNGEIVNSPLRGAPGATGNQITVPTDGVSRAQMAGNNLRSAEENGLTYLPVGTILMWYGALGSLPTGWQLCDGTNGSPDMRDRFPLCASGPGTFGVSGGSSTASGTTSSDGAHTHTAVDNAVVLTTDHLPTHRHSLLGDTNAATTDTSGLGHASTHSVAGRSAAVSTANVSQAPASGSFLVSEAGSGASHNHGVTVSTDGAHTHSLSSIQTIPKYHSLYFIMRVS